MHPEIAKRFDSLEDRRKALVSRVKALPPDKQTAREGKEFSPVEVIRHFALAEEFNLKLLAGHPPETLRGKKPKTTFLFKKTVDRMRQGKRRVMPPPMLVPHEAISLEQADKNWAAARDKIRTYLETPKAPADPFIRFFFVFGIGSAADFLNLQEAHMAYHESFTPKS